MTTPTNGTAQKTLFWLLGSLLTVIVVLMGILSTARTSAIEDIASRVAETEKLTTKHETDIGYIKESIINIDKKLDILVNQRTR